MRDLLVDTIHKRLNQNRSEIFFATGRERCIQSCLDIFVSTCKHTHAYTRTHTLTFNKIT